VSDNRDAERIFQYFERRLSWPTRSRSDDHRSPPLIVLTEGDPVVRTGYLKHCLQLCEQSNRVPHAIERDDAANRGDSDPLGRLLDGLRTRLQPGGARLSFPRYDLVRHLMGAPSSKRAQAERARRAVRAYGRERLPVPGMLRTSADGSKALGRGAWTLINSTGAASLALYALLDWPPLRALLVCLGLVVGAAMIVWLFPQVLPSVRTAQTWLREYSIRPSGGTHIPNTFLDRAESLLERAWSDTDLRHLMIDAWYDDICGFYRSWRVRGRQGSVVAPCVVLLDHVAADSASAQLIARVDERRSAEWREHLGDPLLVVASVDGPEPPDVEDKLRAGLVAVAVSELDPEHRTWPRRLGDGRRSWYQVIRLSPSVGAAGAAGVAAAAVASAARRVPRWPVRAKPVFAPAVAAALLFAVGAAYGAAVAMEYRNYCDASPGAGENTVRRLRPTGECVGITDGSFVFDEGLAHVEGLILAANNDVAYSGKPAVTVLVLASFTVLEGFSSEGGAQNNRTVLEGLAVAQREHNNSHEVQVRMLIANSGWRTKHAELVAKDIVSLAENDPRLVGVVGLGASRIENQKAIRLLDEAAIPMVASTVTADRFGVDPDTGTAREHYYQVAPSNDRQASIIAEFASPGAPTTRDAALRLPPARSADIVYDPEDFYSKNLADDFDKRFRAKNGSTSTYPYVASKTIEVQARLRTVAREVCNSKHDLVFYAGRGVELEWLVRGFADTPCNTGRIVIAGGDEVANLVEDHPEVIKQHDFLRLFYTAIAYPWAWHPTHRPPGTVTPPFYDYYSKMFPGDNAETSGLSAPNDKLNDGQAILTYDAAMVLEGAITDASEVIGNRTPERADVARQLQKFRSGTEEQQPIGGASGLLDFTVDTPTYAPHDKLTMLLGINSSRARPALLAVCGKQTEASSPDRGCPSVD
jgi:hypothetical protein